MSQRSDDRTEGSRLAPSRDGARGGGPAAGGDRGGSFLDDFLTSVLAVVGVGVLLFAVAGVWPPMVAIESGSMEPHINQGDLVFVMEEQRFPGDAQYADTGVVTAQRGAAAGYEKFKQPGDVIVFEPDGNGRKTPIIHRAMFWVNDSENWYDKADPDALPAGADGCEDIDLCPAPNAGFITKGDNPQSNSEYDQVRRGVSKPVAPEWVVGTAEYRLPRLGVLRLRVGAVPVSGVEGATLAG